MKYLPIFPDLMEQLEEYPDESVGRLIRAMSAYAFAGTKPDFAPGSPERLAWPFCRWKVDEWQRKSEAQSGNRRKPDLSTGEPDLSTENQGKPDLSTENQIKPIETNLNQPKPTETKRNPQSQSQSQSQEMDTHEDLQQHGDARARGAVPAGQYDADHPERPFDSAWRFSELARRRIAQRILDAVAPRISKAVTVVEGDTDRDRVVGREIFEALQAAMAGDIPPDACQQLGLMSGTLWRWEARLKQFAISAGSAPEERFAVWQSQLDQLREDLDTPMILAPPDGEAAHG